MHKSAEHYERALFFFLYYLGVVFFFFLFRHNFRNVNKTSKHLLKHGKLPMSSQRVYLSYFIFIFFNRNFLNNTFDNDGAHCARFIRSQVVLGFYYFLFIIFLCYYL